MNKIECDGCQVHPSSALPSIPCAPMIKVKVSEVAFTLSDLREAWSDAGFHQNKFSEFVTELLKKTSK